MFEKDLLKAKRVLITGGGTGLGRSIGDRYLALGADLVICGRREAVLKEAADRFARECGAQVETHVCDVRSADAVEAMMELIFARRPLDVLVNNAAGNFIAQTHKLSTRAVDAVLGIVLHGSAYCTIAAGRRWIEAGRGGTVLSILTLSALQGGAFTVPSAIAKAGVLAMTKSLAVEWGPKGIRLVAVAPGPFPTPGAWSRLMPQERQAADPKIGKLNFGTWLNKNCATRTKLRRHAPLTRCNAIERPTAIRAPAGRSPAPRAAASTRQPERSGR